MTAHGFFLPMAESLILVAPRGIDWKGSKVKVNLAMWRWSQRAWLPRF